MSVKVDKQKCYGCGLCVGACPQEAIRMDDIARVDPEKCTDCGACVEECPNDALSMPEQNAACLPGMGHDRETTGSAREARQ